MHAEISLPFKSDNMTLIELRIQEELRSKERVWITFRFQQRELPHLCFTADLWMEPDTAVELYKVLGKSQCVQTVKAKAQQDFEDFGQEGQEYDAFIGAAQEDMLEDVPTDHKGGLL